MASFRFQHTAILSSEFNSATPRKVQVDVSKMRTTPSSGDVAQASARLTMSPQPPFTLARYISREILQLVRVSAGINSLGLFIVIVIFSLRA